MRVIWSPAQLSYDGGVFVENGRFVPSPETPARVSAILAELQHRGFPIEAPTGDDLAPILAIHDAGYVEFLRTAAARMHGSAPVWTRGVTANVPLLVPNVHPRGSWAMKPAGAVGLLGWYTGDMACEINTGTWDAAFAAAQTAIAAARAVLQSGEMTYALCRPPGHHSGRERAMGFCFLNNAAIAAEVLRISVARVAILDIDVHHGNGTQEIFYDRGDVFFASIHGDPSQFYPFYWGYPEQVGTGDGTGTTLNVPYPLGSGDDHFLAALRTALRGIQAFGPEALVLSFGTDAFLEDPHGRHRVGMKGFATAARLIAELALPTVIVQEGGYPFDGLGRLTADVLDVIGARIP